MGARRLTFYNSAALWPQWARNTLGARVDLAHVLSCEAAFETHRKFSTFAQVEPRHQSSTFLATALFALRFPCAIRCSGASCVQQVKLGRKSSTFPMKALFASGFSSRSAVVVHPYSRWNAASNPAPFWRRRYSPRAFPRFAVVVVRLAYIGR